MSGVDSSTSENETIAKRGNYALISRQQKEIFIRHYEEGKTIAGSARIASINVNTAKTILYRYKRGDEEITVKKRGGKRAEKVTENVLKYIEDLVEETPNITLQMIKETVFKTQHINLSSQTVANSLKKLKITLNKTSFDQQLDILNEPLTRIDLRKDFALHFMQNVPKKPANIIFIDVAGFSLHLKRTSSTSTNITVSIVRPRNVTLIVAISAIGVMHHNIYPNSNCSSAKFCSFLQELLDKIYVQSTQNIWLVMNDAPIHKSTQVKELVDSSSAELIFLSPYSPMLNPLKEVFAKVKLAARGILSDDVGELDILNVINKSLETITQNDCISFTTNMMMKLQDAIKSEHIE